MAGKTKEQKDQEDAEAALKREREQYATDASPVGVVGSELIEGKGTSEPKAEE